MNHAQAKSYFFQGDFNSSEERKGTKKRGPKRQKVPKMKDFDEKEEPADNIMKFGKRIRKSILNNQLELLSVTSN